ncbi:MAG: tetratricopeptide repeat protein [Myxococcales bacterium]
MRLPIAHLVAVGLLLSGCDKLAQMVAEEPSRDQQARTYLAKGRAAAAKGDLPTAQRLLEKAAALNPTDPEPQRTLGGVYEKLGEQAQAIFALKRAAELGSQRSRSAQGAGRPLPSLEPARQRRRALEEGGGCQRRGGPRPAAPAGLRTASLRSGR